MFSARKTNEDELTVKVDKEDKNIPKVTHIDLSGIFFAKTNEADYLEKKVKKMVAEQVQNGTVLILHVIPLNQDTDTYHKHIACSPQC